MKNTDKQKLLHHLAVGAGFIGLLTWFYIGRQLGFLEWITAMMPPKYAGAGLMVAIMLLMTPGCFIWSRYNRWIERELGIKGRYYEEEYDKEQAELKQAKEARKKQKPEA